MQSYKSNIWKMYLLNFLGSLFFAAGVLVPFFTQWGKISYMQIMALQTIFVISIFALEIPTGAICRAVQSLKAKITFALPTLCH